MTKLEKRMPPALPNISSRCINFNDLPSTVRVPILDSKKSNNVLGADGLAFPSSSSSSGLIRPRPFPLPVRVKNSYLGGEGGGK